MPIAANTSTERAEQLIILTERLTGLIDKEVELLNEQRPKDIEGFQEERATLAAIYAQEMQLIRSDRSLVAGVSRDIKDKLAHVTEQFQTALAAHELMLQRIRTVSERIIKAVSDEVARTKAPTLGYGKNATLNARPSQASVPLSVNQVA